MRPYQQWFSALPYLQFHDVHHEKGACNFGGFTTLYDHVFNTVHASYQDKVRALKDRIEASRATRPGVDKTM